MNITEHITTILVEIAGYFLCLTGYFIQRAEGQRSLGINTTAPQVNAAAALVFPLLVGMSARCPLNGIEYIKSGLDNQVDQIENRAAAVQEQLDIWS